MKTVFTRSEEVENYVKKVVEWLPQKFSIIDVSRIIGLMKSCEKSSTQATISKLSLKAREICFDKNKSLILTVWKEKWETVSEGKKILLIYHELLHVGINPKTREYKLKRHDIEDFREILKGAGVDWENADEVSGFLKEGKSLEEIKKV